jgi:DNA-binding CsgD family transcriptional regulator
VRSPGFEGKPLSPGQLAALRLAASGYTSRQIAVRLGTTEQGVHLRLKEAAVRLGAKSRTHAAVVAVACGLLRPDELELPSLGGEPPRGPLSDGRSAQEPARAARDVRGAARAADRRTGPRGAAA